MGTGINPETLGARSEYKGGDRQREPGRTAGGGKVPIHPGSEGLGSCPEKPERRLATC